MTLQKEMLVNARWKAWLGSYASVLQWDVMNSLYIHVKNAQLCT
jgi:hypothetical protein